VTLEGWGEVCAAACAGGRRSGSGYDARAQAARCEALVRAKPSSAVIRYEAPLSPSQDARGLEVVPPLTADLATTQAGCVVVSSEIIEVHPLDLVAALDAHTDAVVDHQLGELPAIDQDDARVDRVGVLNGVAAER
jgi:hypothetical protein